MKHTAAEYEAEIRKCFEYADESDISYKMYYMSKASVIARLAQAAATLEAAEQNAATSDNLVQTILRR